MTTLLLVVVPVIGFAAVLLLAGLCVAAGRADAHLDQLRDTEPSPHSVEPGGGTPGPAHPLDETRLVWLWPPLVPYDRERRQG